MESIVKLRRHVYDVLTKSAAYAINDLIDEIERDVAELTDERDLLKRQWEAGVDFDQRLEECADNREDVTLFGVDYTALPLDADGVPIHVGDVMEWPDCSTAEVVGIGNNTFFYVEEGDDAAEWSCASDKCHHHAPTVEDVMVEFATDWESAQDGEDKTAVLMEYAAKLQLKED